MKIGNLEKKLVLFYSHDIFLDLVSFSKFDILTQVETNVSTQEHV